MPTATDQVARAVTRVQDEVPKLAKLKLVFSLELTAGGLTGPGQSECFRVELPGRQVSEGAAEDARLRLSVPRTMFNLLAQEGQLVDWREAFHYGHLKVDGDRRVMRLIGRVIGGA